MKTTFIYHKELRSMQDTKLFRQLFELQIALESQKDLKHQYNAELEEIIASIDSLFDRIIQS